MKRRSIGCLAVLLGLACLLGYADKADAAEPEKLIRVALECDQGFDVEPLHCLGADIVNLGGHSKDDMEKPQKKIAFDCLPGATVWLTWAEGDAVSSGVVTIRPEDDGKVIRLRFAERACYKNDVLCTLDFSKAENVKDIAKQLDMLRQAKTNKKLDGLSVVLNMDNLSLTILQELKGSGVGIAIDSPPDAKSLPDAAFQERCRAIGDVEPRLLEIDVRGFDLVKDHRARVESLILLPGTPKSSPIPDLSKLTSLRHLVLVVEKDRAIDVKPLEKLTQLKALTICALGQECENAGAIGSLQELQFLSLMSASPPPSSVLNRLSSLRYLAATFPADTDFAFAAKMPNLQTLCILNISEKHNLKPLEKLAKLRCLALSQAPEGDPVEKKFEAKNFKNVKEFEKARPDVEVVQYRGICLGSFWLIPLVVAAAVAAWLIRRRSFASRLSC